MRDSIDQLVRAVTDSPQGDQRAAAKLMTLLQDYPERLTELLARSPHLPEPNWILGVTGAPGVGKSTLVGGVISELRSRYPTAPIGVVAIDPSARESGGAVLGDRLRMMTHALDSNLFIRSLASRGRLGGLTRGLAGILAVFRLLRCQYVLVETVGVGQSEMDVSEIVDHVALVLAPGHGDSVQLLKSGVMEIADCLIVNQADRADAAEFFAAVQHHLQWTAAPTKAAQRVAMLVSAAARTGIDELLNYLDQTSEELRAQWTAKRDEIVCRDLRKMLLDRVDTLLRRRTEIIPRFDAAVDRLRTGESCIDDEANRLVNLLIAADGDNQSMAAARGATT